MTCCASGTGPVGRWGSDTCTAEEIALASRSLGGGLMQTTLSVPQMRSPACIRSIETTLSALTQVTEARANLSLRRVTVCWRSDSAQVPDLIGALAGAGFSAHLPTEEVDGEVHLKAHLTRALAVAGFCSMNIMLLSVSVWAGAESETRYAFHLISGLLALPAVLYSGSTFYVSAWTAVRQGRLNMEVPISVGVIASFALSVYDALSNSRFTYFEASTSLLFVLLGGRLLDRIMQGKAKSAASGLLRLMPRGADALAPDGSVKHIPLTEIETGMTLLVSAGSRFPVDGVVHHGSSEVDGSMVSGEAIWRPVSPGTAVWAGEMNQSGPLRVLATATADGSLITEMALLLAAAEGDRSRYRRIADRAASFYAPVVHGLSVMALLWWLWATGDLHRALTVAVSVLVITCPCALGLAVPMVQVVLTRRLLSQGVIACDGSAFERLAEVDTVAFDKTGTLTTAIPRLLRPECFCGPYAAIAGSLACHSNHPIARALAKAYAGAHLPTPPFENVTEVPGLGLEGDVGADRYRLGRPEWVSQAPNLHSPFMSVGLSRNGSQIAEFDFAEPVRPGARKLVQWLRSRSYGLLMLTGDREAAAFAVADDLGIEEIQSGLLPVQKVKAIEALRHKRRKVLMVGDGLNDAPALRAASVSMAPASASDLGRTAADFIILGDDLSVVAECIASSRSAMALVRQNFLLAAIYNVVSIPLAFTGYVTPLMAAVAMSTSSILVVANALRLAPKGRVGIPSVSWHRTQEVEA